MIAGVLEVLAGRNSEVLLFWERDPETRARKTKGFALSSICLEV